MSSALPVNLVARFLFNSAVKCFIDTYLFAIIRICNLKCSIRYFYMPKCRIYDALRLLIRIMSELCNIILHNISARFIVQFLGYILCICYEIGLDFYKKGLLIGLDLYSGYKKCPVFKLINCMNFSEKLMQIISE